MTGWQERFADYLALGAALNSSVVISFTLPTWRTTHPPARRRERVGSEGAATTHTPPSSPSTLICSGSWLVPCVPSSMT
jgi:hypothetical protein